MPKQVTLSKFFVSKTSKSSRASFVTDDDTTLKKIKNNKTKGKRKSLHDDDSIFSTPSKKICSSVTRKQSPSGQNVVNNNSVMADSTLNKLSQFVSNSEPNPSTSRLEYKPTTNPTSFLSETQDSDHIQNTICLDVSDDDVDAITLSMSQDDMSMSQSDNLTGKFAMLKGKSKSSPSTQNKNEKCKYTPLEQQFMDLKLKYSDAILFVECGYKYRFFGEDAVIAGKVLKIFAHPDHNFMTASIPTHRLFVHVRRLVAAGYKVGVVKQTETAALKAAGSNKSAPFDRKLTSLYTKSTLIGEDVNPLNGTVDDDDEAMSNVRSSNYLMCVYDAPTGLINSKKQVIGIVAVDPSTGVIIHDSFEDDDQRSELEKRITHIQPVELLLPNSLSEKTDKMIGDIVALSSTDVDRIRIERLGEDSYLYSQALENIVDFYGEILVLVKDLPKPVICCLSALIVYLKDFNLDITLKITSNFQEFSTRSKYLQLGASTVHNLELFQNLTDGNTKGSLFWVINHTVTRFGRRQMMNWLANPCMDIRTINDRQLAVEELSNHTHAGVLKLRSDLAKLPDLQKGLQSIYNKTISPMEFYLFAKALEKMYNRFTKVSYTATTSLLGSILHCVPIRLERSVFYAQCLDEKAARENDKTNLFRVECQEIRQKKTEISSVEKSLREHLKEIRLILKQPSLNYVKVLQTEFMVEVRNTKQLKLVPSDWMKVSSTKAVSRFHPPFVVAKYKELNQLREELLIVCSQAWQEFLSDFLDQYDSFQSAIKFMATLDCLLSLHKVAQQDGYCRPEVVDDTVGIVIDQGRHPIVDLLKQDQEQYVPNNTHLQSDGERVMIITGPNMGGKSSYIRQVALLAIMAQIGAYVPAKSFKMGVIDAIYTRMGAADEIFKGRSTFMVELSETSHVMEHSTERSLVILDELGRGTSTHDGVAIAYAALDYFINKVKCLTLFVTHYPMLSEFESKYPETVHNYHMSFLLHEDDAEDEVSPVITFLYQLVKGAAAKSYGLNVAALASISSNIIKVAAEKSAQLEHKVHEQRRLMELFQSCYGTTLDVLKSLKNS